MNRDEYYNKIKALKMDIGRWDISLGKYTKADYVIGYYYNPETKLYDVFINNERGRQRVRLSTGDELEALEKLVSMMEFEVESNK